MAIFASFLRPLFPVSRVEHISDMHSKFALGPHRHTMCASMVDIQSAAAEIRRGKKRWKKEEGKKLQGKNIMAPLLHSAAINNGHQQCCLNLTISTNVVLCILSLCLYSACPDVSMQLPVGSNFVVFSTRLCERSEVTSLWRERNKHIIIIVIITTIIIITGMNL